MNRPDISARIPRYIPEASQVQVLIGCVCPIRAPYGTRVGPLRYETHAMNRSARGPYSACVGAVRGPCGVPRFI